MQPYLMIFLVSFCVSIVLTPVVAHFAFQVGAVDIPNQRKVHDAIMPRLGGVAVFLGFAVAAVFLLGESIEGIGVLFGGIIVLALGIADDVKGVSPKVKVLFQALAAGVVVASGISINFVGNPLIGNVQLGIFSTPLTVLWILALTNAMNLIDGLDGLASGVSVIALLTFALIAFQMNYTIVVLLSLALAGSVLGFLRYNFFPAKIFLGDSGSMFLGFMISVLAIIGFLKSVTIYTFVIPIFILAVPIFDTCFAILRRYFEHRPIFQADKQHLHHRLLRYGLSHKKAVLTIYCISVFCSISAFLITKMFR